MIKILNIFLVTFITLAANCYAEPNKALYELQERCSKRTAEVFNDEGIQKTEEGQALVSYENHFSPSLNRCFVRQSITTLNKSGKPRPHEGMTIYEVNEGKKIAYMAKFLEGDKRIFLCFVNGKKCSSEEEFNELIKPYMDN